VKRVDRRGDAVDRNAERVQASGEAGQNLTEVVNLRGLGQQPVADRERIGQQLRVEPVGIKPAPDRARRRLGRRRERRGVGSKHGFHLACS